MKINKFRKIAIVTYVSTILIDISFLEYFPSPSNDVLIKSFILGFETFSVCQNEIIKDLLLLLMIVSGLAFLITAWKNLRISLYLCIVLNAAIFLLAFFGDSAIGVSYEISEYLFRFLGFLEGFIFSCVLVNEIKNAEVSNVQSKIN